MKSLKLDLELAGSVLADDVSTDDGRLLLSKGKKLTKEDLVNLMKRNIDEIMIEEVVIDSINQDSVSKKFEKKYQHSIEHVKDFFQQAAMEESFDKESVVDIFDQMYDQMKTSPQLFLQLRTLQNIDDYTYQHSLHVGILSALLAKLYGFDQEEVTRIGHAGFFHDIGKAKIPPEILQKPSVLNSKEFEYIQKHTQYGYEILLKNNVTDNYILDAALMHHERIDGSGYPLKKKGDQIPVAAQIVAIADVYDAICSKKVYKNSISPFHAYEELRTLAFQKILNPDIVFMFLHYISKLMEGQKVLLSNGEVGTVVFAPHNEPNRPIVTSNGEYLNLSKIRNLYVKDIIGATT